MIDIHNYIYQEIVDVKQIPKMHKYVLKIG